MLGEKVGQLVMGFDSEELVLFDDEFPIAMSCEIEGLLDVMKFPQIAV